MKKLFSLTTAFLFIFFMTLCIGVDVAKGKEKKSVKEINIQDVKTEKEANIKEGEIAIEKGKLLKKEGEVLIEAGKKMENADVKDVKMIDRDMLKKEGEILIERGNLMIDQSNVLMDKGNMKKEGKPVDDAIGKREGKISIEKGKLFKKEEIRKLKKLFYLYCKASPPFRNFQSHLWRGLPVLLKKKSRNEAARFLNRKR